MTRELTRRIAKLETESPASWARSAEKDFWADVQRRSEAFDPHDGELGEAERVARYSPLEHLAWQLRFRGEADLEAVLPLYDLGGDANLPATEMQKFMGWSLLRNWMPGD